MKDRIKMAHNRIQSAPGQVYIKQPKIIIASKKNKQIINNENLKKSRFNDKLERNKTISIQMFALQRLVRYRQKLRSRCRHTGGDTLVMVLNYDV